jgi:single-stranded-DNA-specific exonuclease
MQKRWVLKSKTDVKITNKLREELNINTVLAELLVSRELRLLTNQSSFLDLNYRICTIHF